jgi:hypothetical protein
MLDSLSCRQHRYVNHTWTEHTSGFSSGFKTKTLYAALIYPVCSTCLAHPHCLGLRFVLSLHPPISVRLRSHNRRSRDTGDFEELRRIKATRIIDWHPDVALRAAQNSGEVETPDRTG